MRTLIALLVTALLLHTLPAVACICFLAGQGCTALAPRGDAVFVGTVIAKTLTNADGDFTWFVVGFSVTEVFKGVSDSKINVITTDSSLGCGYDFEVGKSYLVYADEHNGELSTSACSGNRPAATAAAIIQQLRALKAGRTPATIFGEVARMPQDGWTERVDNRAPLAGVTIRARASNDVEYTAETNADGAYEFHKLPATLTRSSRCSRPA